jgi:hypothetical protein
VRSFENIEIYPGNKNQREYFVDEDSSSGRSASWILPVHRCKRHCGGCETEKYRDTKKCAKYLHGNEPEVPSNARVSLRPSQIEARAKLAQSAGRAQRSLAGGRDEGSLSGCQNGSKQS